MAIDKKIINSIGPNSSLWHSWPVPMAHLVWLWFDAVGSNPARVGYMSLGLCIYSVQRN